VSAAARDPKTGFEVVRVEDFERLVDALARNLVGELLGCLAHPSPLDHHVPLVGAHLRFPHVQVVDSARKVAVRNQVWVQFGLSSSPNAPFFALCFLHRLLMLSVSLSRPQLAAKTLQLLYMLEVIVRDVRIGFDDRGGHDTALTRRLFTPALLVCQFEIRDLT
jgi:hypothetical protein